MAALHGPFHQVPFVLTRFVEVAGEIGLLSGVRAREDYALNAQAYGLPEDSLHADGAHLGHKESDRVQDGLCLRGVFKAYTAVSDGGDYCRAFTLIDNTHAYALAGGDLQDFCQVFKDFPVVFRCAADRAV